MTPPQDSMADEYAAMAEFHDLFMQEPWEQLRAPVRAAFGDLDSSATVLEIGAGTGVGTQILAAETTAGITAVEPSLVMRAALTMRCAANSRLSSRVTILADAAPALSGVDGPIHGFVLAHVLGHLDPDSRRETFARLAELAAPDCRGLLTFSLPASETTSSSDVRRECTIGHLTYRADYHASPTPHRYHSTYSVLDGSDAVRQVHVHGAWHQHQFDDLRRELATAGFSLAPTTSSMALATREG